MFCEHGRSKTEPCLPPVLGLLERSTCGDHLAGRRLAGVDLRLRSVALGCRGGLLACERFLFHGHYGFLQFYLNALRIPLEQVESQIRSAHAITVKLLKTNECVKIICRTRQNQPRTRLC